MSKKDAENLAKVVRLLNYDAELFRKVLLSQELSWDERFEWDRKIGKVCGFSFGDCGMLINMLVILVSGVDETNYKKIVEQVRQQDAK